MRTRTLRRKPGRVLAVVTVLGSLSGLAQAQQSGLFPLKPIRRERVPCPNEEPVYKLYRNQYYGYYPTQWRPFPQGWNLTGPETPNSVAEFKKTPLQAIEAPPPEDNQDAQGAPDGAAKPAIPNPPPDTERSPFEMDAPDNAGGVAPPRRPAASGGNAPAPGAARSPFETPADKPAGPAPSAPGPRPAAPAAPSLPDAGTPDLKPPGPAPDAPRASRNNMDDETEPASARRGGPLLAMPDATLPTVAEAGAAGPPAENTTGAVLGGPGAAATVATTAAPPPTARRGRLSAIFGGNTFNWLRR